MPTPQEGFNYRRRGRASASGRQHWARDGRLREDSPLGEYQKWYTRAWVEVPAARRRGPSASARFHRRPRRSITRDHHPTPCRDRAGMFYSTEPGRTKTTRRGLHHAPLTGLAISPVAAVHNPSVFSAREFGTLQNNRNESRTYLRRPADYGADTAVAGRSTYAHARVQTSRPRDGDYGAAARRGRYVRRRVQILERRRETRQLRLSLRKASSASSALHEDLGRVATPRQTMGRFVQALEATSS